MSAVTAKKLTEHPAAAEHAAELNKLEQILSRGKFITAAQIVVRTGCSRPAAYRRIKELIKRGAKVQTMKLREGVSGPESIGYTIVKSKKRA